MTNSRGHVFIIGSPRSGTSVLHWSLCQSPRFWGRGESIFLIELANAIPRAWSSGQKSAEDVWLKAENVDQDEFYQAIGSGVNKLVQSRAGQARWVDQTPAYAFVAGNLARMFPDSRFLALFRDGRQVVPSIQKLLGYDFSSATRMWSDSCRATLELLADHPGRCHPVCYEELVLEPARCLERVYAFLGEPLCSESVSLITDRSPINSSFEDENRLTKLQPRWRDWSWLARWQFKRHSQGMVERLGYETNRRWARPPPGAVDDTTIRETIDRVRARLNEESGGR